MLGGGSNKPRLQWVELRFQKGRAEVLEAEL